MQYQYGTNPRKTVPKKQRRKAKYRPKLIKNKVTSAKYQNINLVKVMIIVFSLLFIIIYRNAMINESFVKLQALKKQATSLQKENDRLEVDIQNSINLSNIENVAKESLGMQKLTSAQTVYVSLNKEDYVEATPEVVVIEDDENLISKVINKIIK